jgi:biotin transporter BioY
MTDVSWQKLAMIVLAVVCVLASVTPTFHEVASWLQNLGSLLVGGALIPRGGDTSLKTVETIVSTVAKSFGPPPSSSVPPSQ